MMLLTMALGVVLFEIPFLTRHEPAFGENSRKKRVAFATLPLSTKLFHCRSLLCENEPSQDIS